MAAVHLRPSDPAHGGALRPLAAHPVYCLRNCDVHPVIKDVVATSLTGLALMGAAAAVLLLGLSWSNERWRVPTALVGLHAGDRRSTTPATYTGFQRRRRRRGCPVLRTVHRPSAAGGRDLLLRPDPGAVQSTFAGASSAHPSSWCSGRWLGDASFFNPTLGVLISIGFLAVSWVTLFRRHGRRCAQKSSRPVRFRIFFWIEPIRWAGRSIDPAFRRHASSASAGLPRSSCSTASSTS